MAVFVIGLVDDILLLKPASKLVSQIAVAALLVYFGFRLHWLESRLLDSVLTMVWVVGLTNAFNFLDNMDGLCAGIALIVAIMLLAGFWTGVSRENAAPEMTLLATLAGAAAGFLVFNFPPASIFMGDSGALLFGFSLAALTLGQEGVRASRSDVLSVIAGPAFVLLIPIFDTTLVTVARLLSGRSPAKGGRDHSSHRLVAIGLSERDAVLVLWGLASHGRPDRAAAEELQRRLVDAGRRRVPSGHGASSPFTWCASASTRMCRWRGAGDGVDAAAVDVSQQAAGRRSAGGCVADRRVLLLGDVDRLPGSGGLPAQCRNLLRDVADRDRDAAGGVLHDGTVSRPVARHRGGRHHHRPGRRVIGMLATQAFVFVYYGYAPISWMVVVIQAVIVTAGVIASRLISRRFPPRFVKTRQTVNGRLSTAD